MAPTGPDETTTNMDASDTPASPFSDAAGTTATPFGDWREQLRERVKEIRARKHAVHREDVDDIALNAEVAAGTADKLESARAQSIEVQRQEPAEPKSVEELSVQLLGRERASRRADIAGVVDDLLAGPQPEAEILAPEPVEPAPPTAGVETAPAQESGPEPGLPMETESNEPAAETASEEAVMESVPEDSDARTAPEAAPLFQAEPTVYGDDPILEIAEEFEHRVETVATSDAEGEAADCVTDPPEATIETALEAAVETEAEAKAEIAAATAAEVETELDDMLAEPAAMPISNAPLADHSLRDAIPPELRDVEIPAWALPREPSRASRADTDTGNAEAASTVADRFLVGEYSTPEGGKRTDLGPPADTPIPTAELLNQSIGDLSAASAEGLPEKKVAIAPPGGLVDAADFEPSAREEAPVPSRALPGLFDLADAEGAEESSRPGLVFDEPLAANEADNGEPEPVAEEASTPVPCFDEPIAESVPAAAAAKQDPAPVAFFDEPATKEYPVEGTVEADEGASMEWDVDNDLDAELVADARRQHADGSAPLSDRVYSAAADGLVLLTIGVILMIAGAAAAGSPLVPFVRAAPIPLLAAWSLFGLVYGVIFVGTCGQTIGKMAMRVRVISADSFHVGYGRAAMRALAYALAALPAGLGLLTAIRDPDHRGLHDRLTSTRVVKA